MAATGTALVGFGTGLAWRAIAGEGRGTAASPRAHR
jgi:hypothetical protein